MSPACNRLVQLGTLAQLTLAIVTLDEPAYLFDITVFWKSAETSSDLVAEAFRGLELVDRQVVAISGASPTAPIHLQSTKGITSVTLRCTNPSAAQFELHTMRYRTLAFERDFIAEQARCKATGHLAGGGKLAWLPNHDYEVIAKVRTTVDYQGTPQTAEVTQRAGFRTKGLPGLNAVETAGAELEPYVESVYPGPTGLLYRSEPIVVAFDERFSSMLPVDRDPLPGAIPEQTQLLEWVVAVDARRRHASVGPERRLGPRPPRHGTAATTLATRHRRCAGQGRRASCPVAVAIRGSPRRARGELPVMRPRPESAVVAAAPP